jgi:arylsulfatase
MLPFITGSAPSIHEKDFINGWETCGRAAVRRGDWKMVFVLKPKGPGKWQLYNLAKDPGEIHDLVQQEPERMERMLKLLDQYVLETGVIPLNPALGDWIKATEEQMPEDVWTELRNLIFFWTLDSARKKPRRVCCI